MATRFQKTLAPFRYKSDRNLTVRSVGPDGSVITSTKTIVVYGDGTQLDAQEYKDKYFNSLTRSKLVSVPGFKSPEFRNEGDRGGFPSRGAMSTLLGAVSQPSSVVSGDGAVSTLAGAVPRLSSVVSGDGAVSALLGTDPLPSPVESGNGTVPASLSADLSSTSVGSGTGGLLRASKSKAGSAWSKLSPKRSNATTDQLSSTAVFVMDLRTSVAVVGSDGAREASTRTVGTLLRLEAGRAQVRAMLQKPGVVASKSLEAALRSYGV
jgi:hypothetical protein